MPHHRDQSGTHEIIAAALHRSPVYGDSGAIRGAGPRYCPSIEDKVVRFAERGSHQIFVEPEGLDTAEIYPNGISTSLPFDVQHEFVRTIAGFENAVITRPGYAVEYDFFDPRGLKQSLETRCIGALFFAGQINGTTGYEEAAGQGLIAGLNAARHARDLESWHPSRDRAYIGVMIDDLTTRGASEPYRMFTSRAEYRLQLREDNADLRLTETAHELGLVDDARLRVFADKRDAIARERRRLGDTRICAASLDPELAARVLGGPLRRDSTLLELLRRPETSYDDLMLLAPCEENWKTAKPSANWKLKRATTVTSAASATKSRGARRSRTRRCRPRPTTARCAACQAKPGKNWMKSARRRSGRRRAFPG